MDTKAAFDREAFAKEHGMTMEFVNWFFDKKAHACGSVWFMMSGAMWEGWKESRAAIEIELPQRQSLCASGYGDGYFVPSDAGEGLEYDEVVEAITSHGIRIKGKTE